MCPGPLQRFVIRRTPAPATATLSSSTAFPPWNLAYPMQSPGSVLLQICGTMATRGEHKAGYMMRAQVQRRNAEVTFGLRGGSKDVVDDQPAPRGNWGLNPETASPFRPALDRDLFSTWARGNSRRQCLHKANRWAARGNRQSRLQKLVGRRVWRAREIQRDNGNACLR
jgi:hypothetical protein